MGEKSRIEWTDHTFNPWIGCTKVSAGCAHCYAETLMDTRYGRAKWGPGQARVRTSPANWRKPAQWNKATAYDCPSCGVTYLAEMDEKHGMECYCSSSGTMCNGRRPRVFCSSLADWLDEEVPEAWVLELLALIHSTPNLNWLLLSKRPDNFSKRIQKALRVSPFLDTAKKHGNNFLCWVANWLSGACAPENVWIGATVEDQERADQRIPELLRIPAKVRFLSCEPLLGPVEIERFMRPRWGELNTERFTRPLESECVSWVVCGGESGPQARPMNPDWARGLRDQCQATNVPFLFKQWGEWYRGELPDGRPLCSFKESKIVYHDPESGTGDFRRVYRVGKKLAGRILDGREWNEFPEDFNR